MFGPDTSITHRFVATDDAKQYLVEDNYRRLKRLIQAVHPNARSVAGSLREDDIVPRNVAVFCILLSVGKGWWMEQFRHHSSLSDAALPFDEKSPPSNWPLSGDGDFLQKFCDAQWKFCAPVLSAPFMLKEFPPNMVLPIIHKEILNTKGNNPSLWLIKIHPSYNKLITEAEKRVRFPRLYLEDQTTDHP